MRRTGVLGLAAMVVLGLTGWPMEGSFKDDAILVVRLETTNRPQDPSDLEDALGP